MKDTRRALSVFDMGSGVKSARLNFEGSFNVLSWSAGIVGAACRCISFSVGIKLGTSSRLSSCCMRSMIRGVRAWGRASLTGVHLLLLVYPCGLMLGFSTLFKAMGFSSLMTFDEPPLNYALSFLRDGEISRTILELYLLSSLMLLVMVGKIIYLFTVIVLLFEGEWLELDKVAFY